MASLLEASLRHFGGPRLQGSTVTHPSCWVSTVRSPISYVFAGSSLLSALGGAFLVFCCFKLQRRHKHQVLLSQLLQLGLADFFFGMWTLWANVTIAIGGWDDKFFGDTGCAIYGFMHRFLMILSMLLSLSLAAGLVLQLRRKLSPELLRYVGWVSVPMSILLNIGDLIYPSKPTHGGTLLCYGFGGQVNAVEVAVLFGILCVLNTMLVMEACRNSSPYSVSRRSVGHASRYLLAFIAAYILHVVYHLLYWTDQGINDYCWFHWLNLFGAFMVNSSGILNIIAFVVHVRKFRDRSRTAMTVAFRGDGSLQEVKEIPSYRRKRFVPPTPIFEQTFSIGTEYQAPELQYEVTFNSQGQSLGLVLSHETLEIFEINDGLVSTHNRGHPEHDVRTGDVLRTCNGARLRSTTDLKDALASAGQVTIRFARWKATEELVELLTASMVVHSSGSVAELSTSQSALAGERPSSRSALGDKAPEQAPPVAAAEAALPSSS